MRHLVLALAFLGLILPAAASDSTITYQGQLQDGSGPYGGTADMGFRLFDQFSDGDLVGSQIFIPDVPVSDGLFQVELDFGDVYDQPLWLEVEVDGHVLSPRQRITAAPMAVHALNAPEGSDTLAELDCSGGEIAKWDGGAWVCAPDEDTTFSAGDGLTLSGTTLSLDAFHTDGLYWRRGGNEGTDPDTDFIGTIDETPFEIHVEGERALRFEPGDIPNIIGGWSGNIVDAEVMGATIGGGGCPDLGGSPCNSERPNQVTADFGTIGGGIDNIVSGSRATVGGGNANIASGLLDTVGGGSTNTASGSHSTVGGGLNNRAFGLRATVGGGWGNIASGSRAVVPGGEGNEAWGSLSFAAGRRARANHDGAFVWADSTNADFASTGEDQFLIRAGGGVGINTNSPQATLHVDGEVAAEAHFLKNYGNGLQRVSPIAYGSVSSAGVVEQQGSTDNFSVQWDDTFNRYAISIDDINYFDTNFTAIVTARGTSPLLATTASADTNLLVMIYNLQGERVQGSFDFVVFRP